MRNYFFCPYKTAGKSICEHFNISNIHTLVKDIYYQFKKFYKITGYRYYKILLQNNF